MNLAGVAELIRLTAREEIMPRFGKLASHQIREKKPGDLVTEADTACELALTARLTALLPGSLVLGEEAASADPAVLDHLLGQGPVWIIDPVDGTTNFAKGRPSFGVLVALVVEGETQAGWIHDPVADLMVTAAKGGGAFAGESRLQVASPKPLAELTGAYNLRPNPDLVAAVGRVIRHGSAAQDYLALAQARIDFSVYRRLLPWDHAAGVLVHQEAGGHAAILDGSPYTPMKHEGGILLTPDRPTWDALRPLLPF
jgi:fructose-1,6-bisphosphatase/inositol monophosphatase family enzyme